MEGIGGPCRFRVLKRGDLEAKFSSNRYLSDSILQGNSHLDAVESKQNAVQLVAQEALLGAACDGPERLGQVSLSLPRDGQRQKVTNIEWVWTLHQEVVDGAGTNLDVVLNESDFRDTLGVAKGRQEVGRMGVNLIAIFIKSCEIEVSSRHNAPRSEDARHIDL